MWNPFVKKINKLDLEKLMAAEDARMDAISKANYIHFLERAYKYSSQLILGHIVDEDTKLEYLKFINIGLSMAIQEMKDGK